MNLAAFAKAHKTGMIVAGGGGAVGLALLAKQRSGGANKTTIQPAATNNSTGTDLYNQIEPILSGQQRQIDDLAHRLDPGNQPGPVPILPPVTAPPPPPSSSPQDPSKWWWGPVFSKNPKTGENVILDRPAGNWHDENFRVNNPATNPLVSAAPIVQFNEGQPLPPATGIGQRFMTPVDSAGNSFSFTYG